MPPRRVLNATSVPSSSLSQKWKVMPLIWCLLAGELYRLSPRELSIVFCADSTTKKAIAKFRPCLMQEERLAFFVFVLRKKKGVLPSCRLFSALLSSLR